MSSKWPYSIDPNEEQHVPSTDGTMVGTCYYIAPETILAAGWTVEELELASRLCEDDDIDSVSIA